MLWRRCSNVLTTLESDVVTTSETDVGTTLIFDRATTSQRRCASWAVSGYLPELNFSVTLFLEFPEIDLQFFSKCCGRLL